MPSKTRTRAALLGVVWFLLLLVSFSSPLNTIATSEYDGNWQINVYGVTVHVRLAAPISTVTMVWNWFNASAEIIAINSDPPYNVRTVYIYNLSHLFVTLGSASGGTNSYGGNMTVGDIIYHRNREIISAGSVNLIPGQSTQLTYHVGVEMGVEVENGTLYRFQQGFPYHFRIEAGEDALDYFLNAQQQLLMTIGLASLIIIVFIMGVACYYQRERSS